MAMMIATEHPANSAPTPAQPQSTPRPDRKPEPKKTVFTDWAMI